MRELPEPAVKPATDLEPRLLAKRNETKKKGFF